MKNEHEKYNQLKSQFLTKINFFEKELFESSEVDLRNKIKELKSEVKTNLLQRYKKNKDRNQDLLLSSEDILLSALPLAFALAREVTSRLLGMRHYDEQIVGGIALHLGNIAELKNGEGKTIVALLPAYLNALFSQVEYEILSKEQPTFKKRGVHIVTTNDYLARRDYVWLRPVYEFLGLSVGYLQVIRNTRSSYSMSLLERKLMYSADIVYGATHEFIFDYLRDNHQSDIRFQVQSEKHIVIVDEIDHALLDDARTPHILSNTNKGLSKQDLELVYLVNNLAKNIYQDRQLFVLLNMKTLIPTKTGANVIRIFGKKIINDRDMHEVIEDHFTAEEIIGLIFELIYHSSINRRQEVGKKLFEEIANIYNQTSKKNRFYETDSNGRVIGIQKNLKDKIIDILMKSWGDIEDSDIKEIVSIIRVAMKNLPAFQEIIISSGISPQEISHLLAQSGAFNILQGLITNPMVGLRQMALLVVDFIELFIIEIADISLQDINHLRMFVKEATVFLNVLLPKMGGGYLHHNYQADLNKISEIYLSDQIKPGNSLAQEAFLNIILSIVFPIASNLLAPQKPLRTHNKLLIVALLMVKALIVFSQIEKPKNKAEQQIFQEFMELRKTYTSHLYFIDVDRSQVELTYWSQIIAEDQAGRIEELRLWEQEKSKIFKSEPEALKYKILFLLRQALNSYALYEKNNQYVIQNSENKTHDEFTGRDISQDIVIIGELTGRIMPGRRWQQWRHSFLEAKENIPVRQELRSTASISTQAYFKLYPKISGMTGTAHIGIQNNTLGFVSKIAQVIRKLTKKEESLEFAPLDKDPLLLEFFQTYNMEVVVIPEHRPKKRQDLQDILFFSKRDKFQAIIDLIITVHSTGQPILVETVSVAQSIEISNLLVRYAKSNNIKLDYKLLNALNDEQEAEVITQAGLPGAITVSTQLAGRGTDIVVSEDAIKLGGLFVIGVERRWSRRWDNQISGRAGRQGEPGASQFFLSYDDALLFPVRKRSIEMIKKMGMEKALEDAHDIPIQNKFLNQGFYNQQINYEYFSGRTRAQTEEFDKVIGAYRNYILKIRANSLESSHLCANCLNNENLLSVKSNDFFCQECSKDNVSSTRIPLWRSYFEQVITFVIKSLLAKDNLESELANKYAISFNPNEWEWDKLIGELNQWIKKPIKKNQIIKGIDPTNYQNYQDEINKLKKNIYRVLQEDQKWQLLDEAKEIIRTYEKKEPDLREWDFQALFRNINSVLNINIPINVYTTLPQLSGRTKIMEELTKIVSDAIKYSLKQMASIDPKEKNLLRIIDSFSKYSSKRLTIRTLKGTVQEGNLEQFLINTFAAIYNNLIIKYGKSKFYEFEGEVFRREIDEMWCQFLSESQLRLGEISGDSHAERLFDYEYQIMQLFDRKFVDTCLSFLHKVFESDKELNRRQEQESLSDLNDFFISAQDMCTCQSNKRFKDCCGIKLYEQIKI